MEINDKKGFENVVADHLSRLDPPTHINDMLLINEHFPDEQLFSITQSTWYANIANYLVTKKIPKELNT